MQTVGVKHSLQYGANLTNYAKTVVVAVVVVAVVIDVVLTRHRRRRRRCCCCSPYARSIRKN